MKRAVLALMLMAAPAAGEDVKSAPGGVLRWLDKVSGETADIELSRGQSAISGRLTILMDDCRYPVDNPASNAYAHLTVTDASAAEPVFSGWMVAATPALSALDHARYDVWVLRCLIPDAPPVVEEDDQPAEDEDTTAPAEG